MANHRLYQRPTQIGADGPTRDEASLSWSITLQEGTFGLSVLGQLTTLALGAAALGQEVPDVLRLVLVLELVVQIVELTWYVAVGVAYLPVGRSTPIAYRYIDWVVTTPCMLISIFLFALWSADECMTVDSVFSDGSRVTAIVWMNRAGTVPVLYRELSSAMLFCGMMLRLELIFTRILTILTHLCSYKI